MQLSTNFLSSLIIHLGALALGKQVVQPVGQVEDGKDEREDET